MRIKWINEAEQNTLQEKYITTLSDLREILCNPSTLEDSVLIFIPGKELAYSLQYGY